MLNAAATKSPTTAGEIPRKNDWTCALLRNLRSEDAAAIVIRNAGRKILTVATSAPSVPDNR